MRLESLLNHLPARFSPETSLRGLFLTGSLALTLIACVAIAHGHQRLSSLKTNMADRIELLSQLENVRAQAASLDQQVTDTSQACEVMRARLPDRAAESEFLTLLSASADQFDVTLGDFRPGSIQTRPNASQMELRLRATGSYAGLCQWLDHMTELPRIVHIHHLTLIGPAAPGGDCTVDLQLMIIFGFSQSIH